MTAVVLVPLKPLSIAKSRLRAEIGADTSALVLAMALDVVQAAAACPQVDRVILLCGDPVARAAAWPEGVVVVPDSPGGGLNQALREAAEAVRSSAPGACIISCPADCPAVTADDFGLLIEESRGLGARLFVSDAAGSGTTALVAPARFDLDPRYGAGSRAAHIASGARERSGARWRGLAQDVDCLADLDAARGLGVGRRTRQWLAGR